MRFEDHNLYKEYAGIPVARLIDAVMDMVEDISFINKDTNTAMNLLIGYTPDEQFYVEFDKGFYRYHLDGDYYSDIYGDSVEFKSMIEDKTSKLYENVCRRNDIPLNANMALFIFGIISNILDEIQESIVITTAKRKIILDRNNGVSIEVLNTYDEHPDVCNRYYITL